MRVKSLRARERELRKKREVIKNLLDVCLTKPNKTTQEHLTIQKAFKAMERVDRIIATFGNKLHGN